MPPADYLSLLDVRDTDLHDRSRSAGHPATLATVWSVSLDKLQVTAPAAAQLLGLCAWLPSEPIPLDLFTGHGDLLPEPLASATTNPLAFNDAVGALADFSLARRVDASVIMHRLVQEVIRHRAAGQGARSRAARAGGRRRCGCTSGRCGSTRRRWAPAIPAPAKTAGTSRSWEFRRADNRLPGVAGAAMMLAR